MDNQKFLEALNLGKKHRTALDSLSEENRYLPGEFVSIGQIGPYIGKVTMGDLMGWDLVEEGHHSQTGIKGYRITDLGEAASRLRDKPKQPRQTPRLQNLPPRLKRQERRF